MPNWIDLTGLVIWIIIGLFVLGVGVATWWSKRNTKHIK